MAGKHRRTRRTTQLVADLLAVHVPITKIGTALSIDENTVRRRYRDLITAAALKRGQKGFAPSILQRNLTMRLAAVGAPQTAIAAFLGISRSTLVSRLGRELKAGAIEANLAVGTNLLRMATGPADRPTTVTAAIWWSRARMGWRDTSRIETTGPDGGPIQTEGQVIIVSDNGRGELPASP
jgi:hypothetical protein